MQREELGEVTSLTLPIIGPLALFVSLYLATFLVTLRLTPWSQWVALLSVVVATAATMALWDRGRTSIGLTTRPGLALRDCVFGAGVAACVIGGTDLLVLLTSDLQRRSGSGFPIMEVVVVFVPAVLHEELLFRGYAYQRLWGRNRWLALIGGSALFAALHLGNLAITPLALFNIFLGGILLSLGWERYRRLWFPIGLHLGWNLMSGPILGYEVSGYVPSQSVLRTTVSGPDWLTGGAFGIEGSVWMTAVAGVAILLMGLRSKGFTTETQRTQSYTESSL